jgi:hypothetical protein
MWYDGRYVEPDQHTLESVGVARLSKRRRALLVAAELFRTNRLIVAGNNVLLPPPEGEADPLDINDLVNLHAAQELLVQVEDRTTVEEITAHLKLRRDLVTHFTFLSDTTQ